MFDFDIMATTDNAQFINGIYEDELPIYYEPPKPAKMIPTKEDLYMADTFSFGTLIGSITNKGSGGYALLSTLEKDSKEYEVTKNRLKMSCKLQSAQIDKSKIGKEVKGIPKIWVNRKEGDDFNNSILLDRHPYFFIYLYKDTRKKYNTHLANYSNSCEEKFRMSLKDLIDHENKTEEQIRFLDNFYKYSPVIDSDSNMNRICRKIEQLNSDVKLTIKDTSTFDLYDFYVNKSIEWSSNEYKRVKQAFLDFNKRLERVGSNLDAFFPNMYRVDDYYSESNGEDIISWTSENMEMALCEVCSNSSQVANYLLYMAYKDGIAEKNKEMIWYIYGKHIYDNIKNKKEENIITIPMRDDNGDILYQGKLYSRKEVAIV